MPLDPLETDEKIANPVKRVRDMDDQMLFGCSGFLVASLGGYGLMVWPFFAFQDTDRLKTMVTALSIGLVPTFILSAVVSRRFGLAGTCGAVGGAIASAMFLYLRVQQAFLAHLARQAPEPQYPASMAVVVPLAVLLAVALVALIFMAREPGRTDEIGE
jgi:hypothetical protein